MITVNGAPLFMSPEISIGVQNSLGSDIIMAFDECPPYPATFEYMKDLLIVRFVGQNVVKSS